MANLIDRGALMLDYLERLGKRDSYKAKFEALSQAVDLQAELQPNCDQNRILTLDEVKNIPTDNYGYGFVWIEEQEAICEDEEGGIFEQPDVVYAATMKNHGDCVSVCGGYLSDDERQLFGRYFLTSEYGRTYRVWKNKPTEEERKAATWDE